MKLRRIKYILLRIRTDYKPNGSGPSMLQAQRWYPEKNLYRNWIKWLITRRKDSRIRKGK